MKKKLKADKIWKYKLANPTATNRQIAKACGAHVTYVTSLMGRTGTPKEILEAPKPMKRGDILDKAKEYVTKDRASQHGDMEKNFTLIADYWSIHLGWLIEPTDVAVMMNLLKIARIKSNPANLDNFIDGAGYMACGGEIIGAKK